MEISQEPVFVWLSQYAYEPSIVYLAVFAAMLASGFGVPIPEELTVVSVGILAYMGAHPEQFPPPYLGAPVVDGFKAAVVTLLAVLFADCVIFTLGRVFGRKILTMPRFQRVFTEERLNKINGWVKKYGMYAVFIFRFPAGLRFPAHIMLGMSHIRFWQFILVDGIAATISIPTQILLIYNFGESILYWLHEFKILIISIIGLVIVFLLGKFFLVSRFKSS